MEKSNEKLVRYLYPTKQIMSLMCNDIYQELLEVIPIETCISVDNLNSTTRNKNLEFVKGTIKGFILGNKNYGKVLFDYYKYNNLDAIAYDILIGLTLYISSLSNEFKEIDILKNPQSVCYGEVFILDLIS